VGAKHKYFTKYQYYGIFCFMTVGVSEESSQVHMSEPFEGLLPGIANHEAKLALTAIIASQPDRWFSGTEFYHEIISRQGSEPGWVPDHKWPIKSCVNSLEPVGLVTLGTVTGERGDTTAFKSNDENPQIVDLGYALSGAGQEWSIDYQIYLYRKFSVSLP
jgi:hypothetical protein